MSPSPPTCALCNEAVSQSEFSAHVQADSAEARAFLVARIREDHPDWVDGQGACRRCVRYYEAL